MSNLNWETVNLQKYPRAWIDQGRILLGNSFKKLIDFNKFDFVEVKKGYKENHYCRIGLFFTNTKGNTIQLKKSKDGINIYSRELIRELDVSKGSYAIEKIDDSTLAIIL